jgi:hypothetical protein
LHDLVRPDETAQGRAIQAARQQNPAADMNAQPIVIYDLHRPGAPGLPENSSRPESETEPGVRAGSESEVTE